MFDDIADFEKFSLKYGNDVPKDYDVSELQYTFDFIYLVLKRDSDIDKAIQSVAVEYDLSESYLKEYLIENKFILSNANRNEFSNQLKSYNTKSLKKILKKHGLKTSGKRERIEKRIFENNLIGNDYYLSSKSKIFYKNKQRRNRIFNDDLFHFYYFNEFNDFYMDNYRKKEANIPIEFINLFIDKSLEDKSHENYILNNWIMAEHFLNKKNFGKMLEYVLRSFCMNLNPVWKISDLNDYGGLYQENYDNLIYLQEILGRNRIISNYFLVWDSFNFERVIVSKYDAYRCLKDILNLKDYDKINKDLQNRFYANENLKIKKITQKTLFDF